MPKPLRVVYVVQNLNYGGMERVLHGLASHLPKFGFDVHVVALEYLGRFANGLQSVATLHNPPRMNRLSLLHPVELSGLIRRLSPDIVHSHAGVWLKSARAARHARVPVIVHTEHGRPSPVPWTDRFLDYVASRSTDLVVAVSDPMAAVLRKQVVSAHTPVRTIHNGVDVEQFRRTPDGADLRVKLAIPANTMVVGSIGRLEPVKNYAVALEALALALGVEPRLPVMLLLAGDGSQRGLLERLALQLGVAAHVRFLGWQDDALSVYQALDLFTLTSDSEGTSVSLLEAMSVGVCPAVTDVGGNRAALGPELGGHLVPPGSPRAMCDLWLRLLRNPTLRNVTGARARDRVERSFSLAAMVEAHAQLYTELAMARRAGNGTLLLPPASDL